MRAYSKNRTSAAQESCWRPQPGDVVSGFVMANKDAEGHWGPYKSYGMLDDYGGWCEVSGSYSHLANQLASVKVGDTVTIEYVGRQHHAEGWFWNKYKVDIRRGARLSVVSDVAPRIVGSVNNWGSGDDAA